MITGYVIGKNMYNDGVKLWERAEDFKRAACSGPLILFRYLVTIAGEHGQLWVGSPK